MNLAVLRKSRRIPEAGDFFVMLPRDRLYLYGRVISTDAKAGWSMTGCNLVYVYQARSTRKEQLPELLPNGLLVPPMMTNNLPWTRGYFEFLEHKSLMPIDKLPHHCFKDSYGRYFDEHCVSLSAPIEPVGQWGLHSFQTIDDEISKALGIPLSPDNG